MTWWQAILLGLVEGLTEYLPVSSTGHLILAQQAMGLTGDAANAYAICIQAGAIVAVLGLYWKRVRQAAMGWLGKVGVGSGDADGFRLGLNLLVAFMPAAVFGLLLDDLIESYLFHPWPVVAALFVGGLAILGVDVYRKRREARNLRKNSAERSNPDAQAVQAGAAKSGRDLTDMTLLMALGIGLLQCAAMWPGTSRSLVTIVGGVLVGLSLAAAVEFSFLLGVVTLLAATGYKAIDAGPVMLEAYGWWPMILGSIAAWGSAVLAVRWMVAYLNKHGLAIFGYYRVVLALAVAGLILSGWLGAESFG